NELDKDPSWTPLPPVIRSLPKSYYLLVSTGSLVSLLLPCRRCAQGKNGLSFHTEGMAITVTGKCNRCARPLTWDNSEVLPTARASSTEKLKKVNVDIVNGSVLTAIGATKLRQMLLLSGLPTLSKSSFHRIKALYTAPAITEHFNTITKPAYMKLVRPWVKVIINRCYDAVLTAQGNGEMASEKFRAILHGMIGKHKFDKGSSFRHVKECPHSAPKSQEMFLSKTQNKKAYNRLEDQIFTARNIEDIKSVSWLLQTSPCESINALAWRYASKDHYFTRGGHDMRTQLTMIHWKYIKKTAADGSRPVIGKKSYKNPTHKKIVWRKVRKAPNHKWMDNIKKLTYKV
ncbi:hypothetical protein PFISCL1PPCAC_14420, partial [Pristionchus fissidentatus]